MWLDLHGSPRMGILKPCCIWWWPLWGRGSLWWWRRHGSWGRRSRRWWRRHGWISWRRSNPLPCSSLLLPARHRSPTQRRPRLPGGGGEIGKDLEAGFERAGRRLERNSIYARWRNWGRGWRAGKICRAGDHRAQCGRRTRKPEAQRDLGDETIRS